MTAGGYYSVLFYHRESEKATRAENGVGNVPVAMIGWWGKKDS